MGTWYFSSGDYLRFGSAVVSGDPALFEPHLPKVVRYLGLQSPAGVHTANQSMAISGSEGPIFWDIQANVLKSFRITEKIRANFRMAAYNLTNRANRVDPDLVVTSSTFGQALRQSANTVGRQMEYGLEIVF